MGLGKPAEALECCAAAKEIVTHALTEADARGADREHVRELERQLHSIRLEEAGAFADLGDEIGEQIAYAEVDTALWSSVRVDDRFDSRVVDTISMGVDSGTRDSALRNLKHANNMISAFRRWLASGEEDRAKVQSLLIQELCRKGEALQRLGRWHESLEHLAEAGALAVEAIGRKDWEGFPQLLCVLRVRVQALVHLECWPELDRLNAEMRVRASDVLTKAGSALTEPAPRSKGVREFERENGIQATPLVELVRYELSRIRNYCGALLRNGQGRVRGLIDTCEQIDRALPTRQPSDAGGVPAALCAFLGIATTAVAIWLSFRQEREPTGWEFPFLALWALLSLIGAIGSLALRLRPVFRIATSLGPATAGLLAAFLISPFRWPLALLGARLALWIGDWDLRQARKCLRSRPEEHAATGP